MRRSPRSIKGSQDSTRNPVSRLINRRLISRRRKKGYFPRITKRLRLSLLPNRQTPARANQLAELKSITGATGAHHRFPEAMQPADSKGRFTPVVIRLKDNFVL